MEVAIEYSKRFCKVLLVLEAEPCIERCDRFCV